ncbi:alpha/beta hydrolase [Oceanobacillus salinisoli]|uniref:alpha/beta hydrolase n=1 Tax=Oceanobacillus salinisoli TaxID=2678611 RepID=UPI0012E14AFD|nr:alpha/beta fold hydrolase [Oceanobacillus salinisoli]
MNEKFPVILGAEMFYIKGNEIGILVSHGFMGTPQSVRYIGERLGQFGYTVFAPRLKGHGTHYQDLEKCSHEDWFDSLEKAYQKLKQQCKVVFVMGQSMGGTLALWLAHRHQEINGVILINPALTIPEFEPLKQKSKPRYFNEGVPDIKAKNTYEITYQKVPIKAIHELQNLMEQTPAILPDIHCPVLGFKSVEDHVVPPENTEYIIEHIGSDIKESSVLPNSYHVASLDNDKDVIVESAHDFVQHLVSEKVT